MAIGGIENHANIGFNIGTKNSAEQNRAWNQAKNNGCIVDKVTISSDARKISTAAHQDDSKQSSSTQSSYLKAKVDQYFEALYPNLRTEYSINDAGDIVVKVVNRDNSEVLREIPSEDRQKVKAAISEAVDRLAKLGVD